MKILATVLVTLLCAFVRATPVCVDGVCYPSEEAARADGVSEEKIKAALAEHAAAPGEAAPSLGFSLPTVAEEPADKSRTRVAIGYMKAPQMIAFLRNEPAAKELADHALWMILLLVLAGGLAANLTPCVLPLVPVNLSLVGKGAIRGAAYGLGITTAYGCLGLAAAFGGLAFGTIQSSPWFSLLAACVFVFLGLAVAEVFRIDFSRFRPRTKRGAPKDGTVSAPSLLKPFALGAWSAVLAGACVEPILIATLVLTAEWFAAGRTWSVVLPFVLGAGMGLPWPFAAAGMKVLPRPGAWMRWVNRVFAVMMFGMAAWYGWLAWNAWHARSESKVNKEFKVIKDLNAPNAPKDINALKDPKALKGPKDLKDSKDLNDLKDLKDSKALKDLKDLKDPESGWFVATPATWPQAFAAAKATGKSVFVDVWATWCKNCLAMEKTTFANPDVAKELANYAVVRLQAEDVAAFVALPEFKDLGIKGIPAFVVFDK